MHLSYANLTPEQRPQWIDKGYTLPQYDITRMRTSTQAAPGWLHVGAGNIFRAFPAALQQRLLNQGCIDTGIIVAESYDPDIIDRAYRPYDNLSLLVTLCGNGDMRKEVIASVADSLAMDAAHWPALCHHFEQPSLQMVSFTITEKGYSLRDGHGSLLPDVVHDLANPSAPRSVMGRVAALLHHRYAHGASPIAMVSMDNCSHNGDKLRDAIFEIARHWINEGMAPLAWMDYLQGSVSFPLSMIDKITPRPDPRVVDMLRREGFADTDIIETAKHTYTAPFVNAEEAQYLVIEDHFPNGRPPLEHAGVYFAAREVVDQVERMKVCTCLNPLHTALAVVGCLLGFQTIYEEMRDEDLRSLVERIGIVEGMPVVTDPGILSPQAFLREVLDQRLPNPFLPDTPQRIACDTSQKIPIRFGETLKAYADSPVLDVQSLRCIPFVLAAWLRYLLAVDDAGQPMVCSPDPLLHICQEQLKDLCLGISDRAYIERVLQPLLADARLWGVDLHDIGLAGRVTDVFATMLSGAGAVRRTLHGIVQP